MNKILVFFMLAFASVGFAQTNATTPSTSNSTTTQDQSSSAPAATTGTQSTTGAQTNSGMQSNSGVQTNSGAQVATDNSNAQTSGKVADRLNASATALQEIFAASDKGVPENILSHAKCVVMIPGMKKAGFVVGGRYGRGFATCRTSNGWSAPAPVSLSGGSYGLQIGGESVDVLMLVMNDQGVQHLLSSKFKIGVDANAAAGPIGRSASADTDWKLNSEILTYSRSRGLFAGLELNGAEVKQDNDTTRELYGRAVPFQALLSGNTPAPAAATAFTNEVAKDFSQARANQ
ncbi:MAG TPA: lipid-binding SYLF domain-containing protein [Terriglobales bacterium]